MGVVDEESLLASHWVDGRSRGTMWDLTASKVAMMDCRRPGALGFVVGGVVLFALLLTGCVGGADDAADPVDLTVSSPASLPRVDLSQPPVADDPDPSVRAGAVAGFVDCEHGVRQGGWTLDFGPLGSGADPDAALEDMVDGGTLGMPHEKFVAAGRDDGRVLYVYEVSGIAKAALVIADSASVELDTEDRWAIETFASCDPAEFDSSTDDEIPRQVWQDADGNRVPTSVIFSSRGPEHCDWETVTFLTVDGQGYISDPGNVLDGRGFIAPFDSDASLPPNAVDTGYRRDDRHLWLSSDRSIAYVVTDDAVEVWPSSTEEFACA